MFGKKGLLAPFYILTESLWNSKHGTWMLKTLCLAPHDAFNVRFLAADARSAAELDLALASNADSADLMRDADNLIGQIAAKNGFGGLLGRFGVSEEKIVAAQRDLHGLTNYIYETHLLPRLALANGQRRKRSIDLQ